jgi:hypothetical protein
MPNLHPAQGPSDHGSAEPTQALVLDLLAWLEPGPRPYDEVMDRWRTHCPRLTVWEDAVDEGLVARTRTGSDPAVVALTALGRRRLDGAA